MHVYVVSECQLTLTPANLNDPPKFEQPPKSGTTILNLNDPLRFEWPSKPE